MTPIWILLKHNYFDLSQPPPLFKSHSFFFEISLSLCLTIYLSELFIFYFLNLVKYWNKTYKYQKRATGSHIIIINLPIFSLSISRFVHVVTLWFMHSFNFDSFYISKSALNLNVGVSTSIHFIFQWQLLFWSWLRARLRWSIQYR